MLEESKATLSVQLETLQQSNAESVDRLTNSMQELRGQLTTSEQQRHMMQSHAEDQERQVGLM